MAGDSETALAQSRAVLQLHPRSPLRPLILAQIGNALFFLKRFEEAIPLFKEAQTLRPGHKASLLALAAAHAHLGQIEEARATFERLGRTTFDLVIGIFRAPADRDLLRVGLALAGAQL
jgi:tetratricopeptide (TPR) repeat protein